MDIEEIRRFVQRESYELSIHAQQERLAEDLDILDLEEVIATGEILEDYPNDPRGPSCLVLGYAGIRPVHLVIGWSSQTGSEARIPRIITAYEPKPPKWVHARLRGERS